MPVLRLQPWVDPMEFARLQRAAFDFLVQDHVASRFLGTRARRPGVTGRRHARRIETELATNGGGVTGIPILPNAMP